MTTHTVTPWQWAEIRKDGKEYATIIKCPADMDLDEPICEGLSFADARRITAAVNACAGISIKALESGKLQKVLRLADQIEGKRWGESEFKSLTVALIELGWNPEISKSRKEALSKP